MANSTALVELSRPEEVEGYESIVDLLIIMGLLSLIGGGTLIVAFLKSAELRSHPG